MARAHDRKQQLKKQKAKAKRQGVQRERSAQALPTNLKGLVARAQRAPFGPCWVSTALDGEPNEESPALIRVVVSRRVGGLLLPCVVLVDRTCLGVKNAFVARLHTEFELNRLLAKLNNDADPLRRAEPLLAQSVIFHAIDYARSLGFEPHRDFAIGMLGERPAVLIETPLCRPERPFYVAGPRDDVRRIAVQLEARVGPDGYDLVSPVDIISGMRTLDWDSLVPDGEYFGDGEVLTVEGREAPPNTPALPS